MIELFESDTVSFDRVSSKGNQLKWKSGDYWYKADSTGYEGLSEYVISSLLAKSTLKSDEYVLYEIEDIKYRNNVLSGCKSKNFLRDGEQLITFNRLFMSQYTENLTDIVFRIEEHEERLKYIVERIEIVTGIRDLGKYMAKCMTIDALFLNEDRHMHNIALVLGKDGKYKTAPFFDHGAGLLSDTRMDYPLTGDVYEMIEYAEPKTFSESFDDQLDIAEKIYGRQIKFSFTHRDVESILKKAEGHYSDRVIERVRTIVFEQMRKYSYMF